MNNAAMFQKIKLPAGLYQDNLVYIHFLSIAVNTQRKLSILHCDATDEPSTNEANRSHSFAERVFVSTPPQRVMVSGATIEAVVFTVQGNCQYLYVCL